jgi:hypothetical protein
MGELQADIFWCGSIPDLSGAWQRILITTVEKFYLVDASVHRW